MDTSYYTSNRMILSNPDALELAQIRYIVIDVDGTMTDGGLYYDEHGNEMKRFNAKDAAGFLTAKVCGIKTLVLTGRECEATIRRVKEMQVDYIEQKIVDKHSYLATFMQEHDIRRSELAYIGDDLNDLSAMKLAGFVGCPKDACDEVGNISHYVSEKAGGEGAVREVISHILKTRGQWDEAIRLTHHLGDHI